jgi:protein SCO1/2
MLITRFLSALLIALCLVSCNRTPAPPALYPVPEAELVDASGKPFSLASLKGKVVVYDFIFTRCQGPCPLMSKRMSELVKKVETDDVRFVSISADPLHDTPEILRKYAAGYGVDPRWIFLTGERAVIEKAASQGFKLALTGTGGESDPIVHSTKFILADRNGMIRGYHESLSEEGRTALLRDLEAVRSGR